MMKGFDKGAFGKGMQDMKGMAKGKGKDMMVDMKGAFGKKGCFGKDGMPAKGKSGKLNLSKDPSFMKGMPKPGSAVPPPTGYAGGMMGPMDEMALKSAPPEVRKQMLGERLFLLVSSAVKNEQPSYICQKITGMLLELPMEEVWPLLTSPADLQQRLDEALSIL